MCKTVNAIVAHHHLSLVIEGRIREKSFGDAEGAPYGTKVRNGSETPPELRKRAMGWWKETVAILLGENATDEDKTIHVLVVSHGGFIRCLLRSLIEDPEFNFMTILGGGRLASMSNTGVTTVEAIDVHDARLVVYNDHSHLVGVQMDEGRKENPIQRFIKHKHMPPRFLFRFVRHGETAENRKSILCGHLDVQLNSLGRRQAAAVGVSLQEIPFTYAFASDLSRAVNTANAILAFHQVSLVTDSRLREKYWGDAEGVPYGTKVKNKGESYGDLNRRAVAWWKETVSSLISDSPTEEDKVISILVVSHGGLIRNLVQHFVNDSKFRFANGLDKTRVGSMYNAAVTTVEATGVYSGQLVVYNDYSHLSDIQMDEEVGDDVQGT